MNKYIVPILLIISSCSSTSLKKSVTYSATLGCAGGGALGYGLSPEGSYNKRMNTAMGCATGALVGGALGYMFYKDNPLNEQQKRSIEEIKSELNIGPTSVNVNQNFAPIGKVDLPQIQLPEDLKGKLPNPKLYIQEVQGQKVIQDGKVILIDPHKAYIYTTEEPGHE